jgi:hypothetical protein
MQRSNYNRKVNKMGQLNPDSVMKFDFLDYTGRKSTVTLHTNDNAGALTMTDNITDIAGLRTAFALISGGTITRQEWSPYVTAYNTPSIANPSIQRERVWHVVYRDNVSKAEQELAIPCARVSDVTNASIVDANGFAILTSDQWVAFKSAFEAVARSKDKENVTLLYAYISGVNT